MTASPWRREPNHNAGQVRTVTREDLEAKRAEIYRTIPMGPERTKALRRIASRIKNLEYRSERVC